MKKALWIIVTVLALVTSCNWDEGQCWTRSEDDWPSGAGGGVIVPGTGGYGDAPQPKPQEAGNPPPPECLQVPQGPCYQKCLADYEAAAATCGEIADDAQRRTCQDAAYTAYSNCRQACQQKENDCREACKQQCDRAWEKCRDDCPRGDGNCLNECTQEYGRCLKECDKRCK